MGKNRPSSVGHVEGKLLAVTVIGNDRPGIVAGVTRALYELGCNLEDATSTILRGHFSMTLIVRTPEEVAGRLENELEDVASELQLIVTARPVEEVREETSTPTHMVSVYGADRPGIVYRVAELLASHGANITDLTSRVIGSEEAPVYALMLEVSIPEGAAIGKPLADLKAELGVDVTVHAIEPDVL